MWCFGQSRHFLKAHGLLRGEFLNHFVLEIIVKVVDKYCGGMLEILWRYLCASWKCGLSNGVLGFRLNLELSKVYSCLCVEIFMNNYSDTDLWHRGRNRNRHRSSTTCGTFQRRTAFWKIKSPKNPKYTSAPTTPASTKTHFSLQIWSMFVEEAGIS